MMLVFIFGIMIATAGVAQAQPRPPPDCTQCPKTAPFMMTSLILNGSYLDVITDTCPPYDNPYWKNPSHACEHGNNVFKIPLKPIFAKVPIPLGEKQSVYDGITYLKTNPKPILGAVGVLSSGVQIFGVGSPCGYSSKCPDEGAPTEYVDAVESEGWTVDPCGGHPAPGGSYHVHSGIGINSTQQREHCRLPADQAGEHSKLLGWMFDGYGLYGRYSLGGKVPNDLDECGGHTHEIDGEDIYHYHLPDQFPWTIGCYKGCPEISNNVRELNFITTNSTYGCTEATA